MLVCLKLYSIIEFELIRLKLRPNVEKNQMEGEKRRRGNRS